MLLGKNLLGSVMDLEHIKEVESWDSGGGQLLDILTFKSGQLLVISEDAIVLYKNRNDFESSEAQDRPTIYL